MEISFRVLSSRWSRAHRSRGTQRSNRRTRGDILMFITKKHLSRRTVLRGMGAAIALPFLESMVPAQTRLERTEARPKSRLSCIEMVHGAAGSTVEGGEKHYWSPAKEGADF